ncbi:hypothetical protein [Halodesulfovibrio sp.]|jgi:hypothetical protein|uniref:hypothetical protein n=1 Tax=Halodesulfovibrio sp. TaxID=1912772 RepID=UPI0025D3D64E|nr:hypothetical protein [Halodesulfovibrio sp.]MCT4627931.1 hypothetical protein [Halodesulfovibrio sp.]
MPNQYGEFTADDGWEILNQTHRLHNDRMQRQNMELQRQKMDMAAQNEAERMSLAREVHEQSMALGAQRQKINEQAFNHNAAQEERNIESHGLDTELARANIDASKLTLEQKKRTANELAAARRRANELLQEGAATGSYQSAFVPKNLTDMRAASMVFDTLKHNEEAGGAFAKARDARITQNYQTKVAPNIDRALGALKKNDAAGFTASAETAMHYANLSYQFKATHGGFSVFMRLDKSGGKFVDTGRVMSNDEVAQTLLQVKRGERVDSLGARHNPDYNHLSASSFEATKQINNSNLYDTSKHVPMRLGGKLVWVSLRTHCRITPDQQSFCLWMRIEILLKILGLITRIPQMNWQS